MADRMSKQKKFQHWFMIMVTALATFAELFVCSVLAGYTLYFQTSFGPSVNTCTNDEDNRLTESSGFWSVSILAFGISGLMIGMVYDIKMYLFLRMRRKQIQPEIAMIPWKQDAIPAVSFGSKSNFKATVPIKATCLGAINIIFLLPIMYLLVNQFEFGISVMKIIALLITTFHMPLILLMTVKSNSKKANAQQVQPPAELQFHEPEVEHDLDQD